METKRPNNTEFMPEFEGDYVNKNILAAMRNAGQLAIDLQKRGLQAQEKTSKEDLVTQGDLLVTQLLKTQLVEQFPDIIFVDEETVLTHSIDVTKPGLYAVIDPIDGTGNYYKGYGNWGISIGFVKGGQVVAGIIYQPSTEKMFYAEKGKGAFVNHQRLVATSRKPLIGAKPYFDFPYPKDKYEYNRTTELISNFSSKLQTSEPVKLGSQVIEIMKIAEGEADFFFHLKTKPWDVAAAIGIVTEVGGKIMNKKGEPYQLFDENIIVTNGVIDLQPFFELVRNM